MNKPLLFIDFYGTLNSGKFWSSLDEPTHPWHGRRRPIEAFLFRDNAPLVDDWMRGKHTSEDIHHIIASEFQLDFKMLFEIFKNDCQKLFIEQRHLAAIEKLKSKYTVILSTDNMDSFDRFTLPAQPRVAKVFDAIHNSFNWRMLKLDNDGTYFKQALAEAGADFRDCILIDDIDKICNFKLWLW